MLKLANGEVYSTQHYVTKFVSDLRQIGGFLHQLSLPPRYDWNIVESGVQHHNLQYKQVCSNRLRMNIELYSTNTVTEQTGH